jgi:hypothetical protein
MTAVAPQRPHPRFCSLVPSTLCPLLPALPCLRPRRPQADALMAHLAGGHHLLMVEYNLAVFGLERAADTLVGDAMTRGVRWGPRLGVGSLWAACLAPRARAPAGCDPGQV